MAACGGRFPLPKAYARGSSPNRYDGNTQLTDPRLRLWFTHSGPGVLGRRQGFGTCFRSICRRRSDCKYRVREREEPTVPGFSHLGSHRNCRGSDRCCRQRTVSHRDIPCGHCWANFRHGGHPRQRQSARSHGWGLRWACIRIVVRS